MGSSSTVQPGPQKRGSAVKKLHKVRHLPLINKRYNSVSLMKTLGTSLLGTLTLVFCASPVWALQTHVHPEGIYVHQMAHILFVCALAYLYWDIRRTSFSGRGWVLMRIFCVLMIAWNIVAFTGHIVTSELPGSEIAAGNGYWDSRLLGPITGLKLTYYLVKMDHLVCVPALFFLFLSTRRIYLDSLHQDEGELDQ